MNPGKHMLRRQTGFTLIEMMVVLLIMGIIVGTVVLSINTDNIEEHMEIEMRRIHALLNLARDEAVLQGQEIAFVIEDNKYSFEVLAEDGWTPITDDRVFRERTVVIGTELALVVDDIEIKLGNKRSEDEIPSLNGSEENAQAEKDKRPRVYILSSGEIMPFELILRTEDQTIEFRVRVEEGGEVQMLLPQDLG